MSRTIRTKELGQSKVRDFDAGFVSCLVGVEEDIGWFEIPVDDAAGMSLSQGDRQVAGDAQADTPGQGTFAFQYLVQSLTLYILQGDKRHSVLPGSVGVGRAYVVRREAGESLGLALEASQRFAVLAWAEMQKLEGDGALKIELGRLVDRAHGAGAECCGKPEAVVDDVADSRLVQGSYQLQSMLLSILAEAGDDPAISLSQEAKMERFCLRYCYAGM